MMRRQREEDFVAPEVTLDLMIEILTRLPAKSLMRFKCVSKFWFSLIYSRYFTNLYCTVASPTRSPRLYMSLVEHIQCDSMEVCHNPGKSMLVSFSSSSSNNVESFYGDLTMPGLGGLDMVVLHGLILYKVCRQACIYNPTTRQNVTLPVVKSNIFTQEGFEKCVDYFLGHDPVLDQYKVICTVSILSEDYETVTSEHWVFVLEVGGSWKRIEFNQPHSPIELGVSINGFIYYLANTCMSCHIVVSFDVRDEKFGVIQTPDDVCLGFIEYSGKTAIFNPTNLPHLGLVDLWVLEDGGKWLKKSWILPACQMHLVDDYIDLEVLDTTRNGDIILIPRPLISPYYILYYDLQKNDLKKVEIIGSQQDYRFSNSHVNLILMDKSESIMHLET